MIQNIFWIFLVFVSVIFGLSFSGIMPAPIANQILVYEKTILWLIYLTLGYNILIQLIGYVVTLKRLNFYERIAVDRGGKPVIKGPVIMGYAFIWKIFNYEKMLRVIKVGSQYPIDLHEEREILFDLKEGGKLILRDPKIWIKIENNKEALKAMQAAVQDGELHFEKIIRDASSTVISGYMRSLNVDEAMKMGSEVSGSDEAGNEEIKDDIKNILQRKKFFTDLKDDKGVEFLAFTFYDLDFSDEVTDLRREELQSILDIKIAKNRAEAEADDLLGSLIYVMANIKGITADEVREEIKESPELQKKFLDLYTDLKQREITDVTDIRVSANDGGEVSDIKKGILEVMSLFSGTTAKSEQTEDGSPAVVRRRKRRN